MPELKKPSELLNIPIVKRNFKTAQQIGNFVAIFGDRFYNVPIYTTKLIDKEQFIDFLKHIEKYK